MKISNKILLTAILAVSLASCTNSDQGENLSEDVVASMENDSTEKSTGELTEDVSEDSNTDISENEDNKEDDQKVEEPKAEEKTVINVKNQNKEDSDKEIADDSQNTSEGEEDMDYQDRDGVYTSSLMAEKNGEREQETGIAFVSNIKIEDETLIVEGTIDYFKNPGSGETAEELEKGEFNFKLGPDTKFQAVGGLAEPEIFTADEFIQKYQDLSNSGLGLNIEVQNGIAKVVSFAS